MAAQGVASHCAIMECLRRAMLPDVAEVVAIKLRGNAVQLSRMFSTLVRDIERRQSKPLAERPRGNPSPPASGTPPDDPSPDDGIQGDPPPAGPTRDAPARAASPTDGRSPDGAAPYDAADSKPRPTRSRAKGSQPKVSDAMGSVARGASQDAPDQGDPSPEAVLNLADVPEVIARQLR